jgi:hypothetical protein
MVAYTCVYLRDRETNIERERERERERARGRASSGQDMLRWVGWIGLDRTDFSWMGCSDEDSGIWS